MSEKNNKKLFLLDAYALIYRSYYAFIRNPRINSKGFNTSATFGFAVTIDDVIRNRKPSHIGVVFDPDTPTFRHEIYKPYKAQRPPTPEDIKNNIPYIKQLIEALNIPIIEIDRYEADDVIGALARIAEEKEYTTYMMTSDKDYCQLVTENTLLYKPKRSGNAAEVWGIEEVKKKFGVESPKQVIDVLALWGDSSDNIPGVPGVGEKTAKKLISQFGSIQGVYDNINKLKGKQKENFIKLKEEVALSKKLVTIVTDIPVEFDEERLKLKKPNVVALKELFSALEFKTLGERFFEQTMPQISGQAQQGSLFGDNQNQQSVSVPSGFDDISTTEHTYHYTDTKEKREKLIAQLSQQKAFCFDTETTGLDVHSSDLVGIAFSFKKGEAFYVPLPKEREEALEIVSEFKSVLENNKIQKTGQNIKYDIQMVKQYTINVKGQLFDTMIAHYLLHPEQRHNMTQLAERYLNYSPVPIEKLIGQKGKGQRNMRSVAPEKIKEYAAEDADVTWQLKEILEKKLVENKLEKLFYEIEMPLIYVLADMEISGVKINTDALNDFAKELTNDILKVEKEIHELAGLEFNVGSPKQLGEVLFDRMKIIDKPKKTKTKQYSTSEQELQKIIDKHEIVPKILDYRSLRKLLNTYVEALPKLINPRTGKIHTSFNQAVTSTGRLSSNNPNLQNIPIRTERGREIRKAFVPSDENRVLLSADYSQIELRLIAHISQDENMIEAFRNEEDIHSATAAKIFDVEKDKVSRDMRSKAKSANFGIVYGISSFGLAQNLNIPRKEAKELIDGYFKTYPKIKDYMDSNIKFAREHHFVETLKGRRRYLPDINSRNGNVRGIAERNAINAPIQGSAADVIKIAMINVCRQFDEKNPDAKMILQVHDELVFDVAKNDVEEVKKIVKNEMEQALNLNVPLTVEIGIGGNWLDAH